MATIYEHILQITSQYILYTAVSFASTITPDVSGAN